MALGGMPMDPMMAMGGMGPDMGAPPSPAPQYEVIPVKGGFQVIGPDGAPVGDQIFKSREEAESFVDQLSAITQMGPPMGEMPGGGGPLPPMPPMMG